MDTCLQGFGFVQDRRKLAQGKQQTILLKEKKMQTVTVLAYVPCEHKLCSQRTGYRP